ncbi:MAG: hypothetical protein ABJQ14_08710 [Hyphomicrobiales bacterium]
MGRQADWRLPGKEDACKIVKANLPDEDPSSVQEAAAAGKAANLTEPEKGSGPTWRPEGKFNSQVAFEVINSRNERSGAGIDNLRFSHRQSVSRTQFGLDHVVGGIEAL